ncbi:phenylalanine--tRNA ligase subunit alpha [Buchnera aphidicola]|uniref:Phenylalanine--tRNA ligase alpha subunit n=1 Tax=Buchnera aphidicola subsp. Cinara cedri (strain Cc) TaxID=372461 RepID=Q057Z0_BUCCC|nr:phenylalanine--tRNA ligase subunit alpha [Buchnera aphidicola]ABJ90559.1 phenylalanyl-tRNA synthetase, a subunit [Buchnera aphidicola BCc]
MKKKKEIFIVFKNIFVSFKKEIKKVNSIILLNNFCSKFLGKKSVLSFYFKKIKKFDIIKRKKYSIILNDFKKKINNIILEKKKQIYNNSQNLKKKKVFLDFSLSGRKTKIGSLHPITIVINEIKKIFYHYGFEIFYGPELEHIYYNFDSLNVPINHPSRSKNDTFWFNPDYVLRTQTSSMQIRVLEKFSYPIKVIVPGKVYRHDYDHTHTPMFHQIEGLIVNKLISFSNLKWILKDFIKKIFKKKIKVRFRNSYFPFTCPSAEMDIQNKFGEWIEILGCGMVLQCFKNFDIDCNIYSACAFGIGVERIAMLKYSVSDIRYFFENDIRFLQQFS